MLELKNVFGRNGIYLIIAFFDESINFLGEAVSIVSLGKRQAKMRSVVSERSQNLRIVIKHKELDVENLDEDAGGVVKSLGHQSQFALHMLLQKCLWLFGTFTEAFSHLAFQQVLFPQACQDYILLLILNLAHQLAQAVQIQNCLVLVF